MKTRVKVELDLHRYPDFGLPKPVWLGVKREGIGSSDAPKICGVDRNGSPMSVYLDKIGEREDDEENELMRWGRRLESAVAAEFRDDTGLYPWRPDAMYQHAEIDCALASPDRLLMQRAPALDVPAADYAEAVLEIKTGRNVDVWDAGPPPAYVLQTLHQMEVTGLEHGHIAVLLNGRDYRSFVMERDPILAEMMLEREIEFWQRVVDRNPPPADGHPATTESLKRMYRSVNKTDAVDLPPEMAEVIARFKETAARLKVITTDHEQAANTLRQALGAIEVGMIDGEVVVTWKQDSGKGKGRVDLEALERDHGELVAEYRKPSTARRLLVK